MRRKRQRSLDTTTPVHRKRRNTRSLDGLRGLIYEEASLEAYRRERPHTRIGREPLHELSWANSASNPGPCSPPIFNAKAGARDVAGPDPNSLVYSMTMDTNIARIWLNWCEVLPKQDQEESADDDGHPRDDGELYETYHMTLSTLCSWMTKRRSWS